jgi:hypothetical protein
MTPMASALFFSVSMVPVSVSYAVSGSVQGSQAPQPYGCISAISHNFTRSNNTPEWYLASPRPPTATLVRARPP